MPSILRPSFSIVQHSHDAFPTTYEMPWDQLAERLAQHRVGDKDGTAIICGTFSGTRSSKTLLERWLIALDVEQNKTSQRVPPDPESVAHYLMAKGLAGVIWTTWSHTPELPRYRIVMPLSEPLRPALMASAIDRLLSSTVAANLRLNGVVDAGKFGAASLMFLARHAEGRPFWSRVVDGDPINAKELYSVAYIINEKDAMSVAQRAALRQTLEFSPQVRAKIDRYNALNELTDLLGRYGYRRQGERWKSPCSIRRAKPRRRFSPTARCSARSANPILMPASAPSATTVRSAGRLRACVALGTQR